MINIKLHTVSRSNNKKKNNKQDLIDLTESKITLTRHALDRIDERIDFALSWWGLKHRIALRVDRYEYEQITWNVLITYRWRWVIWSNWSIITYMKRESKDNKKMVRKNRNYYSYTGMTKKQVKKFWQNAEPHENDLITDEKILWHKK